MSVYLLPETAHGGVRYSDSALRITCEFYDVAMEAVLVEPGAGVAGLADTALS